MARGRISLQLEVRQSIGPAVSIPTMRGVIIDLMDGDTTTVHEIAVNKTAIVATEPASPFQLSDNAQARVIVATPGDGSAVEHVLYGPSHVSSPPFEAANVVGLQVIDEGWSMSRGTSVAGRRITAHAYIEETS